MTRMGIETSNHMFTPQRPKALNLVNLSKHECGDQFFKNNKTLKLHESKFINGRVTEINTCSSAVQFRTNTGKEENEYKRRKYRKRRSIRSPL